MTLNDLKKYFTLSYAQFIAKHNIPDSQIDKNVRYEKLTGVNRVLLDDKQWFYFKNGELKVIYISGSVLARKIWSEFNKTLDANTHEKIVRSRAGKTSNQIVFAEQGITASISRDTVDFIEIYPPQTLNDYLANIYSEPGPFIR